jgi:hypothetical protein
MKINLPKKAPMSLKKRADKVRKQIMEGTAKLRKTTRFGYQTIAIGHCERAVVVGDTLHIFNKHSEYERFINA